MARARLHVICGNCGCNDMLTYKIIRDGMDVSDTEPRFEDAVHIYCDNCSTIHNLDSTMPKKETKKAAKLKEEEEG